MSLFAKILPQTPAAPPLVLARGEVFFVRRVSLAVDEPVAEQVLLALEGMAPFPPEQLYHGHLVATDGSSALVFAAFRRRFSAEETQTWDDAALVAPNFLPLLLARPTRAGITVHHEAGVWTGLAWAGKGLHPEAILVRAENEVNEVALLAELRARANGAEDDDVLRVDGPLTLHASDEGQLEARAGAQVLGRLPATAATSADVRDPDFLLARRRANVRDEWMWRALLGVAAIVVLALTFELGAGVLHFLGGRARDKVEAQASDVRQIEAAQTMASRIAELSEKRLMPFEMMAIINPPRPDSVVFQRLVTRGLLTLEVEAQAANADDVGTYANALRALPNLAKVETRGMQARENVTSFILTVEFKAEALRNGGEL